MNTGSAAGAENRLPASIGERLDFWGTSRRTTYGASPAATSASVTTRTAARTTAITMTATARTRTQITGRAAPRISTFPARLGRVGTPRHGRRGWRR